MQAAHKRAERGPCPHKAKTSNLTGRSFTPRRHCVATWATSAKVTAADLKNAAIKAAQAGAKVVLEAADKPRNVSSKGSIGDIVTDTDKAAEAAVVAVLQSTFPEHAILGEEGGVIGDPNLVQSSDYLWCIDPLDGTVNFAHGRPGFCVSVGVLRHATPVAGCVIEFVGGRGSWATRTYAAARNGGATLDGAPISVSGVRALDESLVVTELCWHPELWPSMVDLARDFTQSSRGIRASGAAAANLCHIANGSAEVYYQFMLKPWDVAAGVVILEEAGGRITTADGVAYSVFDRSLLATNDAVYGAALAALEPRMAALREQGVRLGPANVPPGYRVRSGAQLG